MGNDEKREYWLKGWNSAVSVVPEQLKLLLSKAEYNPGTKTYRITEEMFDTVQNNVKDGLYKNMRVGSRRGLDYFFANQRDPKF